MNKLITVIMLGLSFTSFCDDKPYELVNDNNGYSYIQINDNLDSFSFKSDFKSIGNSGSVGYFVYPHGLTGDALKEYIAKFDNIDPKFSKKTNDGLVEIKNLSAGDRIGFYLSRKNGDLIRIWNFETHNDITYIAFDKNGGGKDEWMSVGKIETHTPSGQPLPGMLPMLLLGLGGIGYGIGAKRKRK